uniref:Prefoldin subunit 3 n=1 Tax=Brunneria borealis TaxID=1603012 RepID=A0A481SVQ5_9NEOP|nr:prefoldin subunit [Brunneria borealis]
MTCVVKRLKMEGDKTDSVADDKKKKSYAGIPEAAFVDDVDSFMALEENGGDVDKVLRRLDEQHSKYKFMEYNLASKRRRLKSQIPDLENSLNMIKLLQKQSGSPKEIETQFLLSEQVYVKALVPPTDKVCLWLGANVMLEYPLEEAMNLLVKNIDTAKKNLGYVEHDLDFLRDQFTTTEVNMARVYNWDVKKRQAAKASS